MVRVRCRLAALMIAIAAVAVTLAAFRVAPPLIPVFTFVAVPLAWLRADTRRREAQGRPISLIDQARAMLIGASWTLAFWIVFVVLVLASGLGRMG